MKTNYIVTCWSGNRRFMEYNYKKDCTHFLKIQIEQLNKNKNSLSQITLVINHNPNENRNYEQFINNLPQEINGVPLVILRRENTGMMFGAWFHAYKKYNDFDYYFVTEDDYVPVIDNFDTIFSSSINENCGFLCPKTTSVMVNNLENKLGFCPKLSNFKYKSLKVPTYVVGIIPNKCFDIILKKYDNFIFNGIDYQEIDKGLIFYAMNAENYTIDQLCGYKNCVLRHRHSAQKPWEFEMHGTGPLVFVPSLYLEMKKQ